MIPTWDSGSTPVHDYNKNVYVHFSSYYRLVSYGREYYKGVIQISAQLYFMAMVSRLRCKMLNELNILQSNRLSLQAGHSQCKHPSSPS